MKHQKYSFIIPVYNRPDEMAENLESLKLLNNSNFELIVVEDGSSVKSEEIIQLYKKDIDIIYHYKENEGPSIGRNVGASLAKGEYLIFVDSDCIIPPDYLDIIESNLLPKSDIFGGPDRAHVSFTPLQKAINFSMTHLLTTGGIRGQKKSVDRYYPRSFNLGIKREVFLDMGGFPLTRMHPGEDMVFGIELIKRGYQTQYIHDAFVYHKRRSTLKQFFKQIKNFGKVRYYISRMYPDTFKLTYLFPLVFVLSLVVAIGFYYISGVYLPLYLFLSYFVLLLFSASWESSSIYVGLLSVLTTISQFIAYAVGISNSFITHAIFGKDEYDVIGKDLFGRTDN